MTEIDGSRTDRYLRMSRAGFVRAVGGAAVAGTLVSFPTGAAFAAPASAHLPLEHTELAASLGRRFSLYHFHRHSTVTLVNVDQRSRQNTRDRLAIESFSILFRGASALELPQGIYRFTEPRFGSFPLFIVPAGRDGTGSYFHAVFNRLV